MEKEIVVFLYHGYKKKALHVLNRFSYGPKPGEVEGLEKLSKKSLTDWFEKQLKPSSVEDLNKKLSKLVSLTSGWGIEKPKEISKFKFFKGQHDKGSKKVLGLDFTGNGKKEGERLISFLAHHKSTAHLNLHVTKCHKLTLKNPDCSSPLKTKNIEPKRSSSIILIKMFSIQWLSLRQSPSWIFLWTTVKIIRMTK